MNNSSRLFQSFGRLSAEDQRESPSARGRRRLASLGQEHGSLLPPDMGFNLPKRAESSIGRE